MAPRLEALRLKSTVNSRCRTAGATRWKNPSRKKRPPELQMSQDCRGEGWFFSSFIH